MIVSSMQPMRAADMVPGRRYALWFVGRGTKKYPSSLMLVETVPDRIVRLGGKVVLTNVHTTRGDESYEVRETEQVFEVDTYDPTSPFARDALVHKSIVPFVAVCGADEKNQATSQVDRHVTCHHCRAVCRMRKGCQ